MSTKRAANHANEEISQKDVASTHPLEQAAKERAADDTGALESQADAYWEKLLQEQRSAATSNIDVYLDEFILII